MSANGIALTAMFSSAVIGAAILGSTTGFCIILGLFLLWALFA